MFDIFFKHRILSIRTFIITVYCLLCLNLSSHGYSCYAGNHRYDYQTIRACWISYLDIETYLKDKSYPDFVAAVNNMYDTLEAYDINTVIVHVHPMGDAIYPSDIWPVSGYISTDRTLPDYDPLQIMLDEAHIRNIRFEAWINPYRLSKSDETTADFMSLPIYARLHDVIYSYNSPDGEACLCLDPSKAESIAFIVKTVSELVSNYDIDGIHFDDYFFVDAMYDELDVSTKSDYVNSLISQVYESIKYIRPDCEFGISPCGNIDIAKKQGADIDTWLHTPGYIDYIMPQIYWTDNFKSSDGNIINMFSDMANSWQSANALDIPMYVGLALYRAGEISQNDLGWYEASDNLSASWDKAKSLGFDGYAIFRYEWLKKDISATELYNFKSYETICTRNICQGHINKVCSMGLAYLR